MCKPSSRAIQRHPEYSSWNHDSYLLGVHGYIWLGLEWNLWGMKKPYLCCNSTKAYKISSTASMHSSSPCNIMIMKDGEGHFFISDENDLECVYLQEV